MAAKKTEAKPKAQPKAKAEPIKDNPELLVMAPEFGGKLLSIPALPFTAAQLAEMGRKFKAGLLSREIVIDAHNAYLNAVAKGAQSSDLATKFVKGHLEVIKGW